MDNKYYVYQHVDNDGSVVYVGMGSGARVWRVEGRHPAHKEWMLARMPSNFKWVIVEEGLSQREAFDLEHTLVYSGAWRFNLYNKDRKPTANYVDNRRPVVNTTTGEYFNSVKEAADIYLLHSNSIIRSCKTGIPTKDCVWSYYDPT